MKKNVLSIRAILLLILGTLMLLAATQAGDAVFSQWQRLQKVKELKQASLLSDTIFAATERLTVERDVAIALLHARDEQTAVTLDSRLTESRRQTDDLMQMTLQMLKLYTFEELVPLQEGIITRFAKIRLIRVEIDKAMQHALVRRDKDLSTRWEKEVTALVTQTQNLWIGFIGHFTDINPIVTQHIRYKHLMRIITHITGEERAIIGRLIAENADPTPDEFARLLRGQGIINLAWDICNLLASQSGLFPAIDTPFKEARSHYQNLYGMVHDIFYMPNARHGDSYPISADLWIELSEQATESLDTLKAAAVLKTRHYIERLEGNARRAIMAQGISLLAILCFCAFSFRVLVRRVLLPIERMVEALLAAMRGEKTGSLTPPGEGDEIGKLAQVLYAFQRNMDTVRQASANLARSETLLRSVVDYTLDGLITIDERGRVESFNPACERIFGYRSPEVVGQNIKMLMPEPYHSEHDGYLSHYRQTGEARIIGSAGREVSGKRKNGSVFPMELSVSAFTLEDGHHYSGIIRDITARKAGEEALKNYMLALERSNKELDDFAYIASHDLKEPLRGIHNHSRFLLEDNEGKLDEESVKKLNRLVYLSQRMERLVNDLLYFSRLGRQEFAIQVTDINEVIHDIEKTLEQFLSERNACIRLPQSLPSITCDKPRVTELFRNLITNAVKYNDRPQKSVEIGFLAARKSPQGSVHKNVFYVKDDGCGIAPEFHEEVFRIFKRLQSSAVSAEEGTGVGLTFVKKIVERHGGKIWLESEPGQGTVFYFTLEGVTHDTAQAA